MEDPLAQEFVSWRDKCKSTIRSTYQILSRGTPNLENETWVESANVINGTDTPEVAGQEAAGGPRQLVQAGEVSAQLAEAARAAARGVVRGIRERRSSRHGAAAPTLSPSRGEGAAALDASLLPTGR